MRRSVSCANVEQGCHKPILMQTSRLQTDGVGGQVDRRWMRRACSGALSPCFLNPEPEQTCTFTRPIDLGRRPIGEGLVQSLMVVELNTVRLPSVRDCVPHPAPGRSGGTIPAVASRQLSSTLSVASGGCLFRTPAGSPSFFLLAAPVRCRPSR